MSTIDSLTMMGIRVTGVNGTPGQGTPAVGVVAGSKYFRKFMKNGVIRPAHVELVCTRNHIHYNGDQRVENSDTMKIEAWNRDNDTGDGRGIADFVAKWLNVGKKFSIVNGSIRTYKRRVYNSAGAVVNNLDGTAILVPASSIVINSIRQVDLGEESAKTIAREIGNYNAGMTNSSFFSRPPKWNDPTHGDSAVWKNTIAWRKAQKYEGTKYHGNAVVCMVSGATPADGFPVQTVDNATALTNQAVGQGALAPSIMAMLTPEQQALILATQQGAQPGVQQPAVQQPVYQQPAQQQQTGEIETPF